MRINENHLVGAIPPRAVAKNTEIKNINHLREKIANREEVQPLKGRNIIENPSLGSKATTVALRVLRA